MTGKSERRWFVGCELTLLGLGRIRRGHHPSPHLASLLAVATVMLACLMVGAPAPFAFADELDSLHVSSEASEMFRVYNPNSGEHFYTASKLENMRLIQAGWVYEGVGWYAPRSSRTPVYRLYNAHAGDHHYTTSKNERSTLIKLGWRDEGVGWYSDDSKHVSVLRQYNPNAATGSHNFTVSRAENNELVRVGWRSEGDAWYAVGTAPKVTITSGAQAVSYVRNSLTGDISEAHTDFTRMLNGNFLVHVYSVTWYPNGYGHNATWLWAVVSKDGIIKDWHRHYYDI